MRPRRKTSTGRLAKAALLALLWSSLAGAQAACGSAAQGDQGDGPIDLAGRFSFQDVAADEDAAQQLLADGATGEDGAGPTTLDGAPFDSVTGPNPGSDSAGGGDPAPELPTLAPDVSATAEPLADAPTPGLELPADDSGGVDADSTTPGPTPDAPEPELPEPDPCEADPTVQAGDPCDGDDADLCADGVWVCAQAGLVCGDSPEASSEACNGEDDDCDGQIDEDFVDKGTPCDGPDGDSCADGKWVCGLAGEGVVCDETPAPDPDCDDGDPCTKDLLVGSAVACTLQCLHPPQSPCCGNGITEEGEECDGSDCPTSCDDGNPCTEDLLVGSATSCDVQCAHTLGVDTGSDSDGDTLSDCEELLDTSEATDWQIFNGLTAIVGEPPDGFFTSAQCNLFFGDTWGQMLELFDGSNQLHDVWSGWEYNASSSDYASTTQYDFEPPFTESSQVGIWSSFQLLFTGTIFLEGDGFHCLSVDTGSGGIGPGDIAGRRNCCGRVYIDPSADSVPLAETGYGAGASPVAGCVNLAGGPHEIAIATRHYETYTYDPRLKIRYCFGGPEGCIPSMPLVPEVLQAATGSPLLQ